MGTKDRRGYSPAFKAKMVNLMNTENINYKELAAIHNIPASTVYNWWKKAHNKLEEEEEDIRHPASTETPEATTGNTVLLKVKVSQLEEEINLINKRLDELIAKLSKAKNAISAIF